MDSEEDEEGEDDVFYPIVSVQLAPGLLKDMHAPKELFVGGEASRLLPQVVKVKLFTPDGSDERDKPLERPIGFFLVFELELALNFGVSKRNGNFGMGIELSIKFETRISKTWSSYSGFLTDVMKIPDKLNDGFKATQYYKKCYRDPSGPTRAEFAERARKAQFRQQINIAGAKPIVRKLSTNTSGIFLNTTRHRQLVVARPVFQDDGFLNEPVVYIEGMPESARQDVMELLCNTYIVSLRTKMMNTDVPADCTKMKMGDMKSEVESIPWNKKVPKDLGEKIQKCAQFWLRLEDRYDETLEDYYKHESKEIFTRGLKQDWWELALSLITLKTDWVSAAVGAMGYGPGGVEWIGEHGAEEMLSWGFGIDIINDGGVSGSRFGPQFNWKWFNGGQPFSFKDNFNGWNVGDVNLGSLISSIIDASYDSKVHATNFINVHGQVDPVMRDKMAPGGVGQRIKDQASAGFYMFVQMAGVVHLGKK